MEVGHVAEGSVPSLIECGLVDAVESGDGHGYRTDVIKGDRPLHMLDLEFDA